MTKLKGIAQFCALVSVGAVVCGGVLAIDERYASNKTVSQLISANAQQIALVRIDLAKRSGNHALTAALCSDFERIHKWRPKACRSR